MTALRLCSIAVPFAWKEGPGSDAPILLTTQYIFSPYNQAHLLEAEMRLEEVSCVNIMQWDASQHAFSCGFPIFIAQKGHICCLLRRWPPSHSATAPWRIRAPALWKLDLKFSVFFFSMYLIDCWPCCCKIAFYWVWYKLCWTVKGHDMLEEQRSVSPVAKWKMN